MAKPVYRSSKPGEGFCGTPKCRNKRAPGRYNCKQHLKNLDRIKEEFDDDPRLLYHQRSDSTKRKAWDKQTGKFKKRHPRVPTCCTPGCFELRIPPSAYCDDHADFAGGD